METRTKEDWSRILNDWSYEVLEVPGLFTLDGAVVKKGFYVVKTYGKDGPEESLVLYTFDTKLEAEARLNELILEDLNENE